MLQFRNIIILPDTNPSEIAKYGTRFLPEKNESILDKAADALENALNPVETAGEVGISFFQDIQDIFTEFW